MAVISLSHDTGSGTVELLTERCSIFCVRPRRGVALVKIAGAPNGPVYEALFNQLEPDFVSDAPIELFVDARQASAGAVNLVDWVTFLNQDHGLFKCVHVLVASTVISLSVNIIKHLSRTGDLIQIYTEPSTFNRHLQQAGREAKKQEKRREEWDQPRYPDSAAM